MDLNLKGKYALVTGGSRGIGLAIAKALAEEGCNVAICARTKDGIDGVTAAVKKIETFGVEAIGIVADVLKLSNLEPGWGQYLEPDRVMKEIISKWGTIHILVNNVGGGGRWGTTVEETPEDVWMDVYNKNAMTSIRFTKSVLPFMVKQQWGRVVTIASMYGREGNDRSPWFTMAKSAEITLMKVLSMTPHLVRAGITFNSVAPGNIMIPKTGWYTEMADSPAIFRKKVSLMPMGRLGAPEEVAYMVTFLCSHRANFVNGSCISVDGGESKTF